MAQWKQYSGVWTLQQQLQAQGANNWNNPTPPSTTNLGQGLYVFGENNDGQLGLNNTTPITSPTLLSSDTTWIAISTGDAFSVAIKTNGTMWTWGNDNAGQLGQNTSYINRSSPTQVGTQTNWAAISTTYNSVWAIKTGGTMWSWGNNQYYGELALGNTINRSSPVQIGALTTWVKTFGGSTNFHFAIKNDGTLWGAGNNYDGVLGTGSSTNFYTSLIQSGAATTWNEIGCGGAHFVGTRTDGTLWACGKNNNGQLGLNTVVSRSTAAQVGLGTTWLTSSGAYEASFAITRDGTLWSWGRNDSGQLGQNDRIYRSSPTQVGALTTWKNVACGRDSVFANKIDGTLWAWGANASGQLGDGSNTNKSSPVQITTYSTWYLNNQNRAATGAFSVLVKSAA